VFEAFIYLQLKQLCQLLHPKPKIYYWRTRNQEEVDFVLEQGKRIIAIEVKSSSEVRYSDIQHLQTFLKHYPNTQAAVVLYFGEKVIEFAKKLWAVPLSSIWSHD
jgi:predicted AAA+ superfamily ATPase